MSAAAEGVRALLRSAFAEALPALDPAELVARALPGRPPKPSRVRVVAVGKAALAMARGALSRWPDRIDDVLVVTVDDAPGAPVDARVTTRRAGHPLPDERSVDAAREALARAAELGERDLLLALISGGASALLAYPPEGLSLADKRELTAALLDAGAPITALNTVRRHLSRVKGGRLLAAATPARVLTLILSDVVGGEAHDVGSGPTVNDPTTVDDARAALERWLPAPSAAGTPEAPARASALVARIAPHLAESVKPSLGLRARWQVLADPAALAAEMARRLERAGFTARALGPDEGDARTLVARRLEQARALAPGEAVVIPCEPTLAVPAQRGRGGRAGWIALAAMRGLPPDVALLCGASDGLDGSSGTAGAAVTLAAAQHHDAEIDAALAAYDDATAHALLGTALPGGPTGTNLTDVHALARAVRGSRGARDRRGARRATASE